MWKLAATGAALLITSAVKFTAYLNRTPTLEDYLAFRCGPSEQASLVGSAGHTVLNWAHCWGCYAMAAGAAMLILAMIAALSQRRRVGWRSN